MQPSLTGRDDEHHASAALELSSARGVFTFDGSASLARDRTHFSDPTPPFGSAYDDFSMPLRRGSRRPLLRPLRSASRPGELTLGGDARQLDVTATSLALERAAVAANRRSVHQSVVSRATLGDVGVATTFADRVDMMI